MKLNLGCGEDYRRGWTNVDINHKFKADYYCNLEDADLPTILKHKRFSVIRCANVINYFNNRENMYDFLDNLKFLLEDNGVIELEFMNWSNGEGLRLSLIEMIINLWNLGYQVKILTPRHFIIPTGNVKLEVRINGKNIFN